MADDRLPPMSAQDLDDWASAVDARSNVSVSGRVTPENVISAGQAVTDVISARRGRS
jgi:hypothetical protein